MSMSSVSATNSAVLQSAIREIPDFPKPGILFKDITPILKSHQLFTLAVESFSEIVLPQKPQYIVGIESRGFLFGAPLAHHLGLGFVLIRKKGKLPYSNLNEVVRHEYALEYGTDCVEIHADALPAGARVVLMDDLLATGGTAAAALALLNKLQVTVTDVTFLIELCELQGRQRLLEVAPQAEVHSLIQY